MEENELIDRLGPLLRRLAEGHGHMLQDPYRSDLFQVFYEAEAWVAAHEFFGDRIMDIFTARWGDEDGADDRLELVGEFCRMWDRWCYAVTRYNQLRHQPA